jgi:hypothetical protein
MTMYTSPPSSCPTAQLRLSFSPLKKPFWRRTQWRSGGWDIPEKEGGLLVPVGRGSVVVLFFKFFLRLVVTTENRKIEIEIKIA